MEVRRRESHAPGEFFEPTRVSVGVYGDIALLVCRSRRKARNALNGFSERSVQRGAAAKFGHKQFFVAKGDREDVLRSLLRTLQPSQFIDQDAQQGTGRSLDQFLPSPRQ